MHAAHVIRILDIRVMAIRGSENRGEDLGNKARFLSNLSLDCIRWVQIFKDYNTRE